MNNTFKILSIDGGGIKGLYSLYLLNGIEKKYCKNDETLSDYFDLICGTSTGGIIALGLASGMKTQTIINIYENNAKIIFPQTNIFNYGLSLLCGYKYTNKAITNIADKYFKNKKLSDLQNLVCIPSYKNDTGMNIVFKNPHSGLTRDKNILIKDVILSTSCAPTYFPMHSFESEMLDGSFIDGGIWANNPSLVGIDEALTFFVGKNKQFKNYDVLSVGNIDIKNTKIPKNSKNLWNVFNTGYLIETILSANANSIDKYCDTICKSTNGKYTRIKNNTKNNNLNCTLDNTNDNVLAYYKQIGKEDAVNFLTPNNKEYKNLDRFFDRKNHI